MFGGSIFAHCGKRWALVLQQERWMRCRAELATHTTRLMNATVALRQPPVDSRPNNCHMFRFNFSSPLKIRFNAPLSGHLTCLRVQPSILIAQPVCSTLVGWVVSVCKDTLHPEAVIAPWMATRLRPIAAVHYGFGVAYMCPFRSSLAAVKETWKHALNCGSKWLQSIAHSCSTSPSLRRKSPHLSVFSKR